MFDDNNEYIDYDRLIDDSEDLMDDDYYGDDDDQYDYDYANEREFDCYYHTLADELTDE